MNLAEIFGYHLEGFFGGVIQVQASMNELNSEYGGRVSKRGSYNRSFFYSVHLLNIVIYKTVRMYR